MRVPGYAGERVPAVGVEAADAKHVVDIGVDWAVKQAEELMSAGVPSIHFYIMQNSDVVSRVVDPLRQMA